MVQNGGGEQQKLGINIPLDSRCEYKVINHTLGCVGDVVQRPLVPIFLRDDL